MKPPPFEYHAPDSLSEAVALLAQYGEEAKVLAGGQSLVPLLNFRLARPEQLIDINGLGALSFLRRENGRLRIGALTRQATLEHSQIVASHWPLLTEAVRFVAHPQIRNRGTVGGSLAHGDPAAELPVAFTALDAKLQAISVRGRREISISDFFETQLTTALEPDVLVVGIDVEPSPPRSGQAFAEYSRRNGDFALGGAAAAIVLDQRGDCAGATIVLLGAGAVPLRASAAEEALRGHRPTPERIAAAAAAAGAEIEPTGDRHASGEYRRQLIERMAARATSAAADRAMRSEG